MDEDFVKSMLSAKRKREDKKEEGTGSDEGEGEGAPKTSTPAKATPEMLSSGAVERKEADQLKLDAEVLSATDNTVVSGELNALASLIAPAQETGDNFKLRLFADEDTAAPSPAASGCGVEPDTTITLATGASSHRAGLDSLVASLSVAPAAPAAGAAPSAPEDDLDLLDLLDAAS